MKLRTLLLTLVALLGMMQTRADVVINETNFPDQNFRNWLLWHNYGKDGMITDDEIEGITSIAADAVGSGIASLKGIEFFTALEDLHCSSNQLTSLDVSKNTALKVLNCSYNQLTSLDVSGCTALEVLLCRNNQLTKLDMSGCIALTELSCFNNLLTSLNVSGCMALTNLDCSSNQIKDSGMDAFVKSLPNVSNGDMNVIYKNEAEGNVMTITQVAAAKEKGWTPYYTDNGWSWQEYAGSVSGLLINKDNFPDANFRSYLLKWDFGWDGVITDEEIVGITSMAVDGKDIKSLKGIEFFTALTGFSCSNNQLTSLDMSKNTSLTSLDCSNNQLTSFDVSMNMALEYLRCSNNQLTSLDVSGCTALETLECSNNQLTSLDVSGCTALTELYCYQNKIKGSNMDALVNSLPNVSYAYMYVIWYENEGNVMTSTQIATAKAKGWKPYYTDNGWSWQEYAGSDPSGIEELKNSKVEGLKYYDLNGRQVKTLGKGVYIINGRKVLMK